MLHAASATSSFATILPNEYGWVLLVVAVISLQILIIGFLVPGAARRKYFSEEFMKRHFGQTHRLAFGQDIVKGGYPDMGSGFYAQKLTYQEWYNFNNAQRAHQNFVEFMPSTLIFILLAGLYFPIASAAVGLATAISRVIYAVGYGNNGPKGRLIGALGNDFALLALLILSLISSVYWIQGKSMV